MNALNRFFSFRDRGSCRPDRRPANRRRATMGLEALEGRQLLSTFTVTNTNDTTNTNSSVYAGSLRAAITQSNATTGGTNAIIFKIPSSYGSQFNEGDYDYQINLTAPLPAITHAVNIEGNSQTGGTWEGYPDVEVFAPGSGSASAGVGLKITASNTTVEGLSIGGFKDGGVEVSGAKGVTLSEDWVGISPDGASVGNTGFGVELINGTQKAVIADSVISANIGNGVVINGASTSQNEVEGDTIGLGPGCTYSEPNQGDGVLLVSNASFNSIGGSATSQRNVISGNWNEGVEIGKGADHNLVAGNIIGLDSSGNAFAFGNGDNGVEMDPGTTYNTVGGTSAGAANVISGNVNSGVVITGSGPSYDVVEGNKIGTNLNGSSTTDTGDGDSLSNGWDGVLVEGGASYVTVGGTTAGKRNIISGNGQNGVALNDVSYVVVEGNYIGTDVTGMKALGNGADGVLVHAGAYNCTIGGMVAGAGNLISSSGADGVGLNSVTGVWIQGNDIGTNESGTAAPGLGNTGDGVDVVDSNFVRIGEIGTDPALAENTILGNGEMSIEVSGSTHVTLGKNITT
jgi:hypothetical protein